MSDSNICWMRISLPLCERRFTKNLLTRYCGVPPRGTLDPEILVWCEQNGTILVTNNRASMPVHLHDHLAEGRHIPGIFILNSKMGIRQTDEVCTDPVLYKQDVGFSL